MTGTGSLEFIKLHGLGNDFVLINEIDGDRFPEADRAKLASRLCDRHAGIGGDGVLFIGRRDGEMTFRIFNADGSEAEMCVNGIRCAAIALKLKLAPEIGDEVEISTRGGKVKTEVRELSGNTGTVQVQTYFDPKYLGHKVIEVEGVSLDYHLVNVGNPHAVAFVEESVSEVAVEKIGHALEHHEEFPE
ncbi:MAG: diaminopimelate epimerase, partial [Theionarchaea archaeon]|nr:diaminopimelate epimerase [Theionarchaea archaeon]